MRTLSRQSTATRLGAGALLMLSVVHLLALPAHARMAPYLGLLFAVAALGFLLAALRMWDGRHLDGRLLGGALCITAMAAQLLSVTVGLPGVAELRGGLTPAGLLAWLLETAVLVLLRPDLHPNGRR